MCLKQVFLQQHCTKRDDNEAKISKLHLFFYKKEACFQTPSAAIF